MSKDAEELRDGQESEPLPLCARCSVALRGREQGHALACEGHLVVVCRLCYLGGLIPSLLSAARRSAQERAVLEEELEAFVGVLSGHLEEESERDASQSPWRAGAGHR